MSSLDELLEAIKELKAQAEARGKFNPECWSFEDPFCDKVHEVLIDASVELVGLQEKIDALELKIKHIEEGFEGCCHTCEPVGELNKRLEEELNNARIEICELSSNGSIDGSARVAKERDWSYLYE